MAQAIDIVRQQMRCYNDGDLKGLCKPYAKDATRATPTGTVAGVDAIRAAWEAQLRAFPAAVIDVKLMIADGDNVVAQWTWTGTNEGPLLLPDGNFIPATGKSVTLEGVSITEVRGGKIVAEDLVYDNLSTYTQLGLLHSPV